MTQITPEHEDPVIHRRLASLASFAPHVGFADRVLAQVTVEPSWLLRLREVKSTLFDRQTRWVWASGAAASAVFSFAVYFTVAVTNWPTVQTAWTALTDTAATMPVASSTTLLTLVDTFVSVEGALPAAIAGSVLMMFGCIFGLHRTIRGFQAEQVPIRAIH